MCLRLYRIVTDITTKELFGCGYIARANSDILSAPLAQFHIDMHSGEHDMNELSDSYRDPSDP